MCISRYAETVHQAQVRRAKDRQRAQICHQAEAVEQAQLRRSKDRERVRISRQAETVQEVICAAYTVGCGRERRKLHAWDNFDRLCVIYLLRTPAIILIPEELINSISLNLGLKCIDCHFHSKVLTFTINPHNVLEANLLLNHSIKLS